MFWSKCISTFKILWWIPTSSDFMFCLTLNSLMESQFDWMDVSFNCQKSFSSVFQMFLSRCLWTSKILWWILTSNDSTFCCKFSPLLDSYIDEMDVWNDSNVLWMCPIYHSVDKSLFLQFTKCFEVDVFEHPRFCDEFSHIVTLRFVANSTLCWIHISMERMFEMI